MEEVTWIGLAIGLGRFQLFIKLTCFYKLREKHLFLFNYIYSVPFSSMGLRSMDLTQHGSQAYGGGASDDLV